ncbi:MAG: hypothetical protein RLZZ175_1405 [Bacteroidota bacterium]|jgi:formylglycine-generating enzyme required for sulfatase activity
MYKKLHFSFVFILLTISSFAQNLKIIDILTLYKQPNWENVNIYLSNKNWVYYNSNNKTEIQWTYRKNTNSSEDRAEGWLNLVLDGSLFSFFQYKIANVTVYTKLISEIRTLGFKKQSSSISDGSITTHYSNGKYNIYTLISKSENENDVNNYILKIEKIRAVYKAPMVFIEIPDVEEKKDTYKSSTANSHTDQILTVAGINFHMQNIPSGTFSMGSNNGSDDEKPVHNVTLSAFSMMKYEVTFDQYDAYCEIKGINKPDDEGWGRGARPVINVSWEDANTFAIWLSEQTGKNFRLPTEAEWEYAARGGEYYQFAGSDDINKIAWYGENSSHKSHKVGTKNGNAYGLYDMTGNVLEWCNDWYGRDYYENSPNTNPKGPSSGAYHVESGSCWYNNVLDSRITNRVNDAVTFGDGDVGFSLVMIP